MNVNDKLDHFYEIVISSATAQSIKIVNEYQSSLEKTFVERKAAAETRAEHNYRIGIDHILRMKNRKLSHTTLELKRVTMECTTELTNRIFQKVYEQIINFTKSPEYFGYLVDKIKETVEYSKKDPITIYINPSDEALLPALEKETGVKLTLSNRDFIGGIRAVIPSRTILIDRSFSTKLEKAHNNFNLI